MTPNPINHLVRAAFLDVDFYNEVEVDVSLNKQVTVVVVLANVLAGIGAALATGSPAYLGAIAGAITGLVGWIVWSAIALFIGTRFLGGTADFGQMARVIGFAFTPLVIGIIPWLGFVGAAWALLATVIAIREGLDVSTPRAIVAMLPGWFSWLLLSLIVQGAVGFSETSVWPL
jgi:hypothetical protein